MRIRHKPQSISISSTNYYILKIILYNHFTLFTNISLNIINIISTLIKIINFNKKIKIYSKIIFSIITFLNKNILIYIITLPASNTPAPVGRLRVFGCCITIGLADRAEGKVNISLANIQRPCRASRYGTDLVVLTSIL